MNRRCLLILVMLLLASCAKPSQQTVQIPEPLEEIKSPETGRHTPGSLWSSDNSSMFADHKAQNVGDIVTVLISEQSSASKEAKTTTGRTSSMGASIPNLFGLEKADTITTSDADLANLVKADFNNTFEGSGTTSGKGALTASLTTQVIGRYPNGNYKIRGGKEVMVNNEVQVIYLTGIIRPVDITAANTIDSNKVLNARISYTGNGSVSDKQQPGWLMRTLDNVWPF
ncbi:MAG: flagellar basal body L-ring protein FlgH [Desulfoprunum sp.]|nr:flagellar basal body L-ring protein FlgH [Desulfoprunum sp.]